MHNFFADHSNDQNTGFGNLSYFGESANDGKFDKEGFRPIRDQSKTFHDIGSIDASRADTEKNMKNAEPMEKLRAELTRKADLDHVASHIQKQDDKKFGIGGFDKDGVRPIRTQSKMFPDIDAADAAKDDVGGAGQYNLGAEVARQRDLNHVADQIQNFDHSNSGTNNEKKDDSNVTQESFFFGKIDPGKFFW